MDLAELEWAEPPSSALRPHGTEMCAECVAQLRGRRGQTRSAHIQTAVRRVGRMAVAAAAEVVAVVGTMAMAPAGL